MVGAMFGETNCLAEDGGDRSPHSKHELQAEYIVPSVFDKRVAEAVAHALEEAAYQTRVARPDSQRAG
jgi:malate dehydrogenase (oxaloacetate-decarboxylating)